MTTLSSNLTFTRPGYVGIEGDNWRIVERVHANGKVYLNLIRRGKVRTVRVR